MRVRDLFTEPEYRGSSRRVLRWWVVFVGTICTSLLVLSGLVGGIAGLNSFDCHRTLTNRGLEGHFDVWGEGCYVHMDDGRVLPLDDVKPTQIELDTREGADS